MLEGLSKEQVSARLYDNLVVPNIGDISLNL